MRLDGRTIRKSSQNMAKSALSPREPDLATPRGYAARITKIGYGKSRVRSKDAKPVTPPLAHFDYAKDFEVTYVHTDTRLH